MSGFPLNYGNNRRCSVAFGLYILFTIVVLTSCQIENGILPHFKVDHQAGKLKITASRDAADISYKNDNVDLVVKPNNKEQAKVIINSMKDNEFPGTARSADTSPLVKEESGQLRSIKEENTPSEPSSHASVHIDTSNDDIGLRRSKINKHSDEEDENEEHKDTEGSDVTWRGRINHSAEDNPPDNKHVLSALSEIKNLMALSMKPPNLKAFDEPLPDSTDKYLHTADNVIKKLERAQEKKRQTEDTQDNRYIHKVKNMINENLGNSTYPDDPTDYAYVQKAHDIIEQEHKHKKTCTGAHCRHHITEHGPKGCVGAHCRSSHDMYMTKEDPEADSAFEDEYVGKIKDHNSHHEPPPSSYNSRDNDYESDENDFPATTHRKSQNHHFDDDDFHGSRISPYHSQDEEGFNALYGGEGTHHSSLEPESFQGGSHNRHIHDSPSSPDKAFEKEFEAKINDKEYGDEGVHHLSHMHPHHEGLHGEPFDYAGDIDHDHDYGQVGAYHPHGVDDYSLPPYHHAGELTDLPLQHHDETHHDFHDDDAAGEGHGREHDHDNDHENYDFDEKQELKDEEHDTPDMVNLNGKLKDWYKMNALGMNPAPKLDEPNEGEIVIAPKENITDNGNSTAENKTSTEDKKIEGKFDAAGEKPLNSSEAEEAINKLNESLASSLNESTIKAISSYDNTTDFTDLNKTTAAALNSFNNIKFEVMNNDSLDVQKTLKDDVLDSHNATHVNKTRSIDQDILNVTNSTAQVNATDKNVDHTSDLRKKITSLEKKINSSGDLMKKLEELEKKMNFTGQQTKKHNMTVKALSTQQKELLRVSPEDVLQTNLEGSDDLQIHDKGKESPNNGSMRTINSSSSDFDFGKNDTLNGTSEISNANETGGAIENVYASIGEPDELKGEHHNATNENSTASDTPTFHEDKHAEQKNLSEKDFDKLWLKHHKKVSENGAEKFGLLKRHKTKGYHSRRGRNGFKRHKTKEGHGFKRHKTKVNGRK